MQSAKPITSCSLPSASSSSAATLPVCDTAQKAPSFNLLAGVLPLTIVLSTRWLPNATLQRMHPSKLPRSSHSGGEQARRTVVRTIEVVPAAEGAAALKDHICKTWQLHDHPQSKGLCDRRCSQSLYCSNPMEQAGIRPHCIIEPAALAPRAALRTNCRQSA